MTDKTEYIKETRAKYDTYDTNVWEKSYFDEGTGGYVVTEKIRIVQANKSKNEQKKFDKEYGMCLTLAKSGYAVEYLEDNPFSYDIHLNGIKADLKKTAGSGNIERYAKEAIREQGAEIVVFEFENSLKDIHTKLLKLKNGYRIHGYFYFSGNKSKIFSF